MNGDNVKESMQDTKREVYIQEIIPTKDTINRQRKKEQSLTSVWNLLSQRYREVLIGLKGSKSILTFFSLPSSVTMVPQYTTKPFGGTGKRQKSDA